MLNFIKAHIFSLIHELTRLTHYSNDVVMKKILFIANLQNICNFIGQDEYNIGRLVFRFNIVLFDKKRNNIRFPWKEKKNRNL